MDALLAFAVLSDRGLEKAQLGKTTAVLNQGTKVWNVPVVSTTDTEKGEFRRTHSINNSIHNYYHTTLSTSTSNIPLSELDFPGLS